MALLEIEAVDQYYGGSHILRHVSLSIDTGKVTAILGRNGVGKTTLLKVLVGLVGIARGRMVFAGARIDQMAPEARARLGIGYVPQGREIFPRLSVEDNLRLGLAGQSRAARPSAEIFELFPVLGQMRRRRGGDLSGGQQQQLAIARALVSRPRLLILDEPTEGIQPSIIKDIARVINDLSARGDMAILLVEQYYEFAKSLADRYAVMARGEIIRTGEGQHMDADGVRALLSV